MAKFSLLRQPDKIISSKERKESFTMYFYEIKCRYEFDNWYKYLYTTSRFILNDPRDVRTNRIPPRLRRFIRDYCLYPVEIKRINIIEYIYDKHFKKEFHQGNRVDWE